MATQVGAWAVSTVFVPAVFVLILLRVLATPQPRLAAHEVKTMTPTLKTRLDTLTNATLETIWAVGASGVAAHLPGIALAQNHLGEA